MMTRTKEVNGTSYNEATPDRVIQVLEGARTKRTRLRLYYGDTKTGRNWMDEHDTIGYIGRSGGAIKIPLLIHNAHSMGGGAILDGAIVKITEAKGGRVLYEHPKFHTPELFVWDEETEVTDHKGNLLKARVQTEDDVLAWFPTREKAERWVDFMTGRRNAK